MQNIFLIGFMGVGKTTVGKYLAIDMNTEYIDVDEEFAKLHGNVSTGDYIRAFGIDAFRPEEQATLRHIIEEHSGAVVATGAGLATFPGNMEIMNANGITVHINVPLDVIASRMTPAELSKRPVWQAQSPEKLQQLYDGRMKYYLMADVSIDGTRPPQECAAAIHAKILPVFTAKTASQTARK